MDIYSCDNFDIIHSHSLFTNGNTARILSKKLNIPYIVAVRNTDINTFFKFMPHLKKLGITILLEASKIIFINKPYRDFVLYKIVPNKHKLAIAEKSVIINNGIDDFWVQNKLNAPKICNEKSIKLLTVGDITKNKNQITTLLVTKLLKMRNYNVSLIVVGEPKDKKIMQKILSSNMLQYIPKQTKDKLLRIYRNADIFILPSHKETFGLVYAEAMTQGLPLVYTKGQGFDETFEEGCVGYHADSRNVSEIADKVECVLKNYKSLSQNCIDLSVRFDWTEIAKIYNLIYDYSVNNYDNVRYLSHIHSSSL